MTYPAATANLVVLWGRWWDHLTKAGVDATITATPLLATGQVGSGSPNLVSLVDQAEIKTAAWTTKPLASSGLWALPLLPTNDAQFGAFGGYRIQCGSEPAFIVEILENTPTITMSVDMIAALNEARAQSSAGAIGISVDDVAQAVWVRQAAVLPQPAVTPPAGVLTSDQVVNLVAGVRQLPPGGTPGQVPSPKAGGGYEWITGGGGGSAFSGNAADITSGTLADARIPASIARDSEVQASIDAVIGGAPGTRDTLKEISDALAADEGALSALTSTVAGKTDRLTQRTSTANTSTTATANEVVPLDTTSGTLTLTGPGNGAPFGARWKVGTAAPTIAAPTGYTINGQPSISMGLAPGGSSGELVVWQAFGADYQPVQGFKPQRAIDVAARANLEFIGTIPAGLGWDTANYPITPALVDSLGTGVHTGSVGVTPEALFDSKSTARSAPGATFYVSTSGNDTNNGLTSGTAFRSLQKAVQAANAAGVPTLVYVAAGVYARSSSLFAASAPPTVDLALVATGGRVVTGTFDQITSWTADGTNTRCWTTAVANCDRVLDVANANDLGNHTELRQVADAAACNLVPGSWALVSGTLYVHRADEAAPTATNTRVFRNQSFNLYVGAAINLYMGGNGLPYGFDLEGCPGSGVAVFAQGSAAQTNPRRLVVLANSSFKYGGGAIGTATCGLSVSAWCGLIAAFNCAADANATDGWNVHDAQGATWAGLLTVNCQGLDNGRGSATSCNGWTMHEAVRAIDIAGRYRRNRGGTVRNINTSKAWLFGTVVEDDLGDQRAGGLVPPTAVRGDDSAELWCERVRTVMPAGGYSYVTGSGTAKIHRRGCAAAAVPDLAVGVIDTY